MKELLEQWAELEPDKCSRNWPDNLNDHAFVAGTQYAVQQAIEARGWIYTLGLDKYGSYWTRIYRKSISVDYDPVQLGFELSGKSVTAALLSAYLQAIKATKANEVAG